VIRSGTNPIGEPLAVLFKREAAIKTGSFCKDNPYLIDLDYWVRLLEHGSGYAMNQTLGAFRLTEGGWSMQLARKQASQFVNFLKKIESTKELKLTKLNLVFAQKKAEVLAFARTCVYYFLSKKMHFFS
jgi:hypothetical protein